MKNIVNQLAKCKEFGHKFNVDEHLWAEIEEIMLVLKPAFNLTIDMQRVGYGLSDFYIGWLRVKKNLQRFVNNRTTFDLATKLIRNMERRASSLFKTPLMLCCIYLDPRMMKTLNDEQKAAAVMDLIKIHDRITESDRLNSQTNRLNDTLDEIQEEFQTHISESRSDADRILQEISVYETEKVFDIRAPVMKFWEENAHKYPFLRLLANVLHAVPSNQCCTERSFSSFSYIWSKHRMSMNPQNVSNVLMVRLNKDVYYSLRAECVQKILG